MPRPQAYTLAALRAIGNYQRVVATNRWQGSLRRAGPNHRSEGAPRKRRDVIQGGREGQRRIGRRGARRASLLERSFAGMK
jgi:hypothetical protein